MINSINEAIGKAREMFVYFSDILQKNVLDSDGNMLGRVWDISAKLGETYPKSGDVIICKGSINRTYVSIESSRISSISDEVIMDTKGLQIEFSHAVKPYDFLLKRDVLDQQVVDTYNHKVRRVNDIHLLKVDHELFVAHVDIGLRGLMRRLGWERTVDYIVEHVNKNSGYLKSEGLVSWKYVQPISFNQSGVTVKLALSEKQLQAIPPADLGDIIFDLNAAQRMAIFRTLDIKTKARVFENIEFEEQKIILKELDKKESAQIITNMSSDEAADLLTNLPSSTVKNLLVLIESGRAKKLSTLLGYSSDSAGGLMTMDFISVPETVTVAEAIDHLRSQTKEAETVQYLYLVDEKNRLKGVTSIRRLLFAEPKEGVFKTIFPKTIYVYLDHSAQEVAYLMDKYKISAIPVVDENKVLQGIITMDDILSQVISIAWRRKKPRINRGMMP
ncbi:MAG: CBS domain-containing protein [Candidatus Omnitrophica bacterium]|nr:CBS domain-containing protein [Candidatus Omnitrophota bacterium]